MIGQLKMSDAPCPDSRNLVLTGFMGTGKSTIGQAVAGRLQRPFIDMDEVIVQRAGKSIPSIFADDGEETFRKLERSLCQELARQTGLVIATGGGALVAPDNRAALGHNGLVICLAADPAVLVARLEGDQNRPLLATDDPVQQIKQLLQARTTAYQSLPHHIDTTYLSLEDAVEAVLTLWNKHCM